MGQQLSLSLELVLLLDWLLKNRKDTLHLLVKEAIEKDLAKRLNTISDGEYIKLQVDLVERLDGVDRE